MRVLRKNKVQGVRSQIAGASILTPSAPESQMGQGQRQGDRSQVTGPTVEKMSLVNRYSATFSSNSFGIIRNQVAIQVALAVLVALREHQHLANSNWQFAKSKTEDQPLRPVATLLLENQPFAISD